MAPTRSRRSTVARRMLLTVAALLLLAWGSAALAFWLLLGPATSIPLQQALLARLPALLALLACALLATVLLAWSLLRPLNRMLRQLRAALQAVACGDWGTQVATSSEFGGLSASFNTMSAELLRSRQELQARNQSLAAAVQSLEGRLQLLQALASTLDRDSLLAQLAVTLHDVFGFVHIAIALPDRDGLLVYDGSNASDGQLPPPQRIALDERTAAGLATLRAEPQLFDDILLAGLLPLPTYGEARAELAVPVVHEGAVLAVLAVQSHQPHTFGGDELALLRSLAGQFAPALTNSGMFRTEQLRRQLAEAIYRVAQKLSITQAPAELPDLLLEQLGRVLPYDRATLLAFEGRQLAVLATRGWQQADGRHDASDPLIARLLREAQPLLLVSAAADARLLPEDAAPAAARSWLGAPMLRQGKAVGALIIESDTDDCYGLEEQRAIAALAGQAAIALENARLYAEAQERMRYLKVVNEMILAVTTSTEWGSLLTTIIQQIRRLVPCDQASIALYNGDNNAFSIETVYDSRGTSIAAGAMFPAEGTPWQLAYNAGQPVYQSDLGRSAFRRDQDLAIAGLRSAVVVPIQGDVGKLGTLNLASRAPAAFGSDQIRLLVELAPYIASALNNLRLRHTQSELDSAREQISERERREVEAEKLRTVGQIASGVAHDFNNLLAGILGNAQLLLFDEEHDDRRKMLRVIEQAARDGAETVRRLQTYTRLDQQAPLSETRLDLLVTDALDLTRPRWRDQAQSRGAQITLARDLRKVAPIAGRPAELREVLTNLIINAVDAMPAGGTLTLRTYEEPPAGGGLPTVVVSVSDSGVGMPAEVRERVFEPFFTTKGQNGTGLGLPVSKGIVEHHGGTISVESEPGQGSSFVIRLPVRTVATTTDEEGHEADAPPCRILVVEDEPVVREALVRLLRAWGHTVTAAAGGEEGMRLFVPGQFDLVFSDLGMPDRSGWEVLALVKTREPRIATVLLTGWGNEIDRDDARARGADQLIAKPFGHEELRKALAYAARAAQLFG